MSTLSGKPANPIDPSGYPSRRSGEGPGGERHPIEDDRDAFRSPYAPKEAWRRAAASPDFGAHDTTTNAVPLAPDDLREPHGRYAVDADESPLCPENASDSGWPGDEQAGNEDVAGDDDAAGDDFAADLSADLIADLGEAASLQPSDTAGSGRYARPVAPRRDAVKPDAAKPGAAKPAVAKPDAAKPDATMSDHDLERLEASLRWLQRQEAATRLPPAPTLPLGPGLAHLDDRGRRRGGDRFAGDFRSPLSLEPERMVPPPALMAGTSNLRWSLYIFIASAVMAGSAYYLSAGGWAPSSQPVARPQLASAVATPALPPAVSPVRQELIGQKEAVGRREAVSQTVARDDDPDVLRELSAQSTRTLKTAKLSARSPEGETVAMLPPGTGAQTAPPPGNPAPTRTLDPAEIALLTKQGEQFVAAGDLVTARMVFRRAAEAGDAYAAMALGATYDPGVLAKLGVVGMGADVEKARTWYQKAESLGSPEATQRLSVLANR